MTSIRIRPFLADTPLSPFGLSSSKAPRRMSPAPAGLRQGVALSSVSLSNGQSERDEVVCGGMGHCRWRS